jgi:hypothetical protein
MNSGLGEVAFWTSILGDSVTTPVRQRNARMRVLARARKGPGECDPVNIALEPFRTGAS